MKDDIQQLQVKMAEFAKVRDWDQFHSPKNLSMALVAEAAELVEHFQWLSEKQSENLPLDKQHAVAEELADIFIYLLRISDKLNVDLIASTESKMQKNEQRYPVEKVKGDARRASEY